MAKERASYNYPPRGMRLDQAANYLGMARTFFLEMVDEAKLPAPVKIRGIVVWDRLDLESAFDDLKVEPENTVHAALRSMSSTLPTPRKKPWSARDSKSWRDTD